MDGATGECSRLCGVVAGSWVTQGHPKKNQGSFSPCYSSLAAGGCSCSAEQKATTVFFQCFESSVALLGEGDGKGSQVSSREQGGWGGGSSWALGSCSATFAVLYKRVWCDLGSEREEMVPWA